MITPYSKITTIEMWTDPYISSQMLKYHLQKNNDIASRSEDTIKKTVSFLSGLIPNNSKICDFGCGPGLYTDLLQKEGYDVTGIDVSSSSLEYAKKTNPYVDYIQMNYIDKTLPKKIETAMMIYCDFGALAPLSQIKVLKRIHDALTDNGLFMFDVFTMNRFNKLKEKRSIHEETNGFFMEGKSQVITDFILYPKLALSLSHQKAVGIKEFELYNWDKHFDLIEIEVLLKDNGFELIDYYSNTYGEKKFTDNETMFLICKKVKK